MSLALLKLKILDIGSVHVVSDRMLHVIPLDKLLSNASIDHRTLNL
jgi:hypothetical protein